MRQRGMRWAALLVCALVFAACGSTPNGSTSTPTSVVTIGDPHTLPSAGTVSATLPSIGGGTDTGDPAGIAADDTAVWIHNAAKGTLVRVDPRTNRVVATIPVGHGAGDVVLEARAVWVLNHDDYTVSRIDPATNQVVATIPLPQIQGKILFLRMSLGVSPGAIWVARESEPVVWKIDPQTNVVADTLYPSASGAPAGTTFAAGSPWLCNRDNERFGVTRLNPTAHQGLAEIDISSGKGF